VVHTFHVDILCNTPLTRSHIAPIISDICSHISPVPLNGAIVLGGAFCVTAAVKTLKPKPLQLLRKFISPDAATVLEMRVEWNSYTHASLTQRNMPFANKAAWIGSTVLQGPNVPAAMRAEHTPDQTELVALGVQGFPAMILYGTKD
jgi:hypothetical protein